MYDDMTADVLLEQMMALTSEDVDKSEGSLVNIACTKQALMLEEAYLELNTVEDNLHLDTMDIDHLILKGEDEGRPIIPATAAIVKGVFQQEIEIGTRFNCDELNYTVLENIELFNYKLQCETAGTVGNQYGGSLAPIDFVDNYQGGVISEVLIPGADQEDEEVYRARLEELRNGRYFGGNRADYKRFLLEQPGVGAAKVKRRASGETYIKPYILNSTWGIPSSTLINAVQNAIDPVATSGEGDGYAPIGHRVLIQAAAGVTINITTTLTLDTGYTYADVKTEVEAAVDRYFLQLAKDWENVDTQYVRIARIEAEILTIEGILDIADTALNGEEENILLDYEEIPLRGTINGN